MLFTGFESAPTDVVYTMALVNSCGEESFVHLFLSYVKTLSIYELITQTVDLIAKIQGIETIVNLIKSTDLQGDWTACYCFPTVPG